MKKVLLLVVLGAGTGNLFAQGALKLGLKINPTVNVASVKDNNTASTGAVPAPDVNYVVGPKERVVADGATSKVRNVGGATIGLTIDYSLSENLWFSSGLYFAQKNLEIYNQDGAYGGASRYGTTYLQLPIMLKFAKEINDGLGWYLTFGPTIDFKMGEKLDGPDHAHYWNMAQNLHDWNHDPTRGKNADAKPMGLFNPIDVSLYFSGGVSYEVIENLDVFLGIMLNKGFVNMINPRLRFAEPDQTKVNTDISIKSFLVGAEIGVAYKLK